MYISLGPLRVVVYIIFDDLNDQIFATHIFTYMFTNFFFTTFEKSVNSPLPPFAFLSTPPPPALCGRFEGTSPPLLPGKFWKLCELREIPGPLPLHQPPPKCVGASRDLRYPSAPPPREVSPMVGWEESWKAFRGCNCALGNLNRVVPDLGCQRHTYGATTSLPPSPPSAGGGGTTPQGVCFPS